AHDDVLARGQRERERARAPRATVHHDVPEGDDRDADSPERRARIGLGAITVELVAVLVARALLRGPLVPGVALRGAVLCGTVLVRAVVPGDRIAILDHAVGARRLHAVGLTAGRAALASRARLDRRVG